MASARESVKHPNRCTWRFPADWSPNQDVPDSDRATSTRQKDGASSALTPYALRVNAHRAWAEIDLDALGGNLRAIRERAGDARPIWLVVKADAYGHGAIAVAHHALRHGVQAFGVGTSAEALELRDAGVQAQILVLGTVIEAEVGPCLQHNIEFGLHSADRLERLRRRARELGQLARVHLNLDTGMGRLGVLPERALELYAAIDACPEVELVGSMTHITAPEGALAESTAAQLDALEGVLGNAREAGLPTGPVHVANSAALFSGMQPLYDAVRPGLAAYGLLPPPLQAPSQLRPVLALRSQVVFMKDIPGGRPLGYGGSFRPSERRRIATLPLGYADGVPLALSNRGRALVRGQSAPVVGQVSMDYTTIDVTDVPGVEVGDVVSLCGTDGDQRIALDEIATLAGVPPHALSCALGARIARVYVHGAKAPTCGEPDYESGTSDHSPCVSPVP